MCGSGGLWLMAKKAFTAVDQQCVSFQRGAGLIRQTAWLPGHLPGPLSLPK